jgi:3-methyladenine DNA glycosylase AlkD
MTAAAEALFVAVRDGLAAVADPAKAEPMRRYMKDHFDFFGVAAPQRRAVVKASQVGIAPLDQAGLRHFAQRCWADDRRELQYVACDVLAARVKVCDASFLATAEQLIGTKSWWDTVDALAAHVVGSLVRRHPELAEEMDDWVRNENIWIARTAILHQLQYKGATDVDRLFRYCLARGDDREFFIRKAIGWALRQYAWTDPGAVRDFLDRHGGHLSPLSVREASKNLVRPN